VVIFDGTNYWLADGFHRLYAALRLGRATIDCRVFEGTLREAILVALKANSAHGLRRTTGDKQRAVTLVLADEEWSKKSTRWIAEVCGVGRKFVEAVRRQLAPGATHPEVGEAGPTHRLGQDGKLRPVGRVAAPTGVVQDTVDPVEQALQAAEAFDACMIRLKKLASEGEKLARGPGGDYFAGVCLDDFQMHLRQAANQLDAARPASRCGGCTGQGCERCKQHGWLSACLQARYS
jgi:hypothetical protein